MARSGEVREAAEGRAWVADARRMCCGGVGPSASSFEFAGVDEDAGAFFVVGSVVEVEGESRTLLEERCDL